MKGIKGIVIFWVLACVLAGWIEVYALDAVSAPLGKGHSRHGEGFVMSLVDRWIDQNSG
jgi:hypothetical protein